MESKDTVMTPEEMITFIPPISEVYEANKMCERQAEISFKAGAIEGYQTGFLDGAKVGNKGGKEEVIAIFTDYEATLQLLREQLAHARDDYVRLAEDQSLPKEIDRFKGQVKRVLLQSSWRKVVLEKKGGNE